MLLLYAGSAKFDQKLEEERTGELAGEGTQIAFDENYEYACHSLECYQCFRGLLHQRVGIDFYWLTKFVSVDFGPKCRQPPTKEPRRREAYVEF